MIDFKPARREGVGLFIGIAGPSGSGKTYSALRVARGIAGSEGRIAAGDTEGRRMSHYAREFNFDVVDVMPPFRPQAFEDLAKAAEAQEYAVLVIDSFSHEWAGEGGVLEWHDELKGDDERRNMSAWIKPKTAHKAMIQSFLQRRIPIVFCLRAEEKVKVLPSGKPEPMGWTPIQDQRFLYELTCYITLSNEAPGVVNYKLPRKIQEQHLAFFPDGRHITEDAGAALAHWARGGEAKDKALEGVEALIAAMTEPFITESILQSETVKRQVTWLSQRRPDLHKRLIEHIAAVQKSS